MRSNTYSLRNTVRMSAFTIAALTILMAAGHEKAKAQQANADIAYQTPMSLTQSALKDFLLSRGSESSTRSGATNALEAFYAKRDFRPVWIGSTEAMEAGTQVRNVLIRADRQGLDPAAYTSSALQAADSPASGKDAAYYDVSLTEALLRYARDVRVGRIRSTTSMRMLVWFSDFDASALELALRNRSVNEFLTICTSSFGIPLAERLWRVTGHCNAGGWPSLTTASESDSGAVKLLVKRLAMEDLMLAICQIRRPANCMRRSSVIRSAMA